MKTTRDIVRFLYNEKLSKNPRTFTEKLRWKMKYDRRPILTLTADKYKVIDYLKENGFGNILKTQYFATDNPREIPFDELPSRYVIKSNHTSGDVIIMDDGVDLVTKTSLCREEIISKCDLFLRRRHWNELNEWAYLGIKPMILVEEFVSVEKGLYPEDFKFLCFNGKVEIVEVTEDRYHDHTNYYFDREWNELSFTWSNWPGQKRFLPKNKIQKPPNFDELVRVADSLSKPFDFVRVDLFNVSGRIYFTEFTHYPAAGIGEFEPHSFDAYVGDLWTLPDIHAIRDNSLLNRLKEIYTFLISSYRLMICCIIFLIQ